jgi:hypothetical protein
MVASDQVFLKWCQMSFYTPYEATECMSFRKTKSILDQASAKALELLRRLCRDSLISPHEVIPMYDFLLADYLTVK